MMDFLMTLAEITLTMSAVILLLLALGPLLSRRYAALWRYWAWLAVAVRLLIPVNISLPQAPVRALAAGGPGGPFPARGGAAPGVPCSGPSPPLRRSRWPPRRSRTDPAPAEGGARPGSAVSGARRCAALALAVRSGRSRAVAWDRIPALPRPCKALGKAGDGPGGCDMLRHCGGAGSAAPGSWWMSRRGGAR